MPLQLLHHLTTTYGQLERRELRDNKKKLNNEWQPDTPIKDLWLHVRKIRHIANKGKKQIKEETAISAVTEVLETSGVFETEIHEWDFNPAADQTYLNLVSHFKASKKERLRKLTSGQAGYHGANSDMMDALTKALNQVEATTAASQAATSSAFATISNTTTSRKTNNTFKYCWTCGYFTQGNGHTGME